MEGLYEEHDFVYMATRSMFHDLCKDLFDRFEPVFEKAFADANVDPADIASVVTIGGGSRVPLIQVCCFVHSQGFRLLLLQEIACKATNKTDLDFTMNADEGIAFGAGFAAANVSLSFRTRPFGFIEKAKIPVGVRLTELVGVDGSAPRSKRFSLFSKSVDLHYSHRIPCIKIIVRGSHAMIERHVDVPWPSDVRVDMFYDDAKNLPSCTNTVISSYNVMNTAQATTDMKVIRCSADHIYHLIASVLHAG